MKKLLYIVYFILVMLFVGLLGGAWYFSTVLLNPGPRVCPKDHYVYCGDPSELNLGFENISYKTVDGFNISGWYIPGNPGAPGVLMVHGRGATRREALRYVPSLHQAGFNLLLIDTRNCGESDKSFNSMGYHERKDVQGGIDYLLMVKKVPATGVFGYSMGASTSIMAMAENQNIKVGVFESGFTDFKTVVRQVAERDYGLPYFPMIPIVTFFFEMRGDTDTDMPTPLKVIGSIAPRPVFIIHGTADQTVYYSHGEALFQAAGHPKQFWTVSSGKHTQAWQANTTKAETDIPAFFLKYLSE